MLPGWAIRCIILAITIALIIIATIMSIATIPYVYRVHKAQNEINDIAKSAENNK